MAGLLKRFPKTQLDGMICGSTLLHSMSLNIAVMLSSPQVWCWMSSYPSVSMCWMLLGIVVAEGFCVLLCGI